jgi:hypothetical protein
VRGLLKVNRAMSAKFNALVEGAEELLTLLPWPTSFEKVGLSDFNFFTAFPHTNQPFLIGCRIGSSVPTSPRSTSSVRPHTPPFLS